MREIELHEAFEIEVLEKIKNTNLTNCLVFIGGTMLRLCYDLPRYSVDLDFYLIDKPINSTFLFNSIRETLAKDYYIFDVKDKKYTMVFVIGNNNYPNRLKIEIRKKYEDIKNTEHRIAYSISHSKQVKLRTLKLEKVFISKIEAALTRKEIRDFFDLEFLLRRGIEVDIEKDKALEIIKLCKNFKAYQFKVKLGSLLLKDMRDYYSQKGFEFLISKLARFADKQNRKFG